MTNKDDGFGVGELLDIWECLSEREKNELYWSCRLHRETHWWTMGIATFFLMIVLLITDQPKIALILDGFSLGAIMSELWRSVDIKKF